MNGLDYPIPSGHQVINPPLLGMAIRLLIPREPERPLRPIYSLRPYRLRARWQVKPYSSSLALPAVAVSAPPNASEKWDVVRMSANHAQSRQNGEQETMVPGIIV
jgi:hypothetical protein